MKDISQADRLQAAAHIKAIREAPGSFDVLHAQEITRLMAPLPRQGPAFSYHGRIEDRHGREWHRDGRVGDRSMRCGAYVVRRYGRNSFEIGHVSDHSSGNDEGLMRLTLKGGRWLLYVNEPRIVRLGRFSFALARFRLWKTGG